MKKNTAWLLSLIMLVLTLSGCFVQPDQQIDPNLWPEVDIPQVTQFYQQTQTPIPQSTFSIDDINQQPTQTIAGWDDIGNADGWTSNTLPPNQTHVRTQAPQPTPVPTQAATPRPTQQPATAAPTNTPRKTPQTATEDPTYGPIQDTPPPEIVDEDANDPNFKTIAPDTTLVPAATTKPPSTNNPDNGDRESSEAGNGAYQSSISGGGLAISDGTYFFYPSASFDGALCRRPLDNSDPEKISDDIARFINVYQQRLYYIAGSGDSAELVRLAKDGSEREVLATGNFSQMCLYNGRIYYTEGSTLYRMAVGDEPRKLGEGGTKFFIDVTNEKILYSTSSGLVRMAMDGSDSSTLIDGNISLAFYVGKRIYFITDSKLYALEGSDVERIGSSSVKWAGYYKKKLFIIDGNNELFVANYDGSGAGHVSSNVSRVSFSRNRVYIARRSTGAVADILDIEDM